MKNLVFMVIKEVAGFRFYLLCKGYRTENEVFYDPATLCWDESIGSVSSASSTDEVLRTANNLGIKQVIEVYPWIKSEELAWNVRRYILGEPTDAPIRQDIFLSKLKPRCWAEAHKRGHFRSEYEALAALKVMCDAEDKDLERNLAETSELKEYAEDNTELQEPHKAKKVRPPSETRKLEKEIIETVKKKRLASIALAEENADLYLRKQHANDVRTHEQTLKTLKARFPKWVFTWER